MAMLSVRDGRIKSIGTKGKKLSMKMLEFIDLYMEHMNANKAIILSSYKTKNPNVHAQQLLQHPLVIAEIQRRCDARAARSEVKADYLILKLMTIIEDTQSDNPQACLRAIELAGKSIALWKERQEISGPDGSAIKHEQQVKEDVADFSSRMAGLVERGRSSNVVDFPERRSESGT